MSKGNLKKVSKRHFKKCRKYISRSSKGQCNNTNIVLFSWEKETNDRLHR